MKISVLVLICAAGITGLFACSSAPPVKELANDSDPTIEMNITEAEIHQDIANQIDVLSPANFASATQAFAKAKDLRQSNKPQKDILYQIALSRAYLEKAHELSKVSYQLLADTVQKRGMAMSAGAAKYFPEEFAKADKELIQTTRMIEENNTEKAQANRTKYEAVYSGLELDSILVANLGPARAHFKQAKDEGAAKLAPKTLEWAKTKLTESERAIVADRHNLVVVGSASSTADTAANRLLKIVRLAKNSAQQTPEQLASQLERDQEEAQAAAAELASEQNQSQGQMNKANDAIADKNQNIVDLTKENSDLADKGRIEADYVLARRLFSPEEADVYKQGNKILLRLKGLSFPSAKSEVTASNYSLLGKVQNVIRESHAQTVVIEGHTDSVGAKSINEKISQDRAKSVEKYLVANGTLNEEKITAKGFGDAKPISTNKTPAGRAQNRRVDVIITDMEVK